MSDLSLERALNNPGRLILNPTAFVPAAGTELGYLRDLELAWGVRYSPVISSDFGEVSEVHRKGQVPILACAMAQWDLDLVDRAHGKVATGTSPAGLPNMHRVDGWARPGRVEAIEPILFCPLDPTQLAIIFHRPILCLEASARLRLAIDEPGVTALVFYATRNDQFVPYQVGRLEDLTLTGV